MLVKLQKRIDQLTTAVAALLIAAMFIVIVANVILRYIPGIGGFKWYMEFSQYANVWAMLIGAAGIAVMGTNLRVEAVDAVMDRFPWGYKVTRIIVDVAELVFYGVMTYSGYLLSTKAKQAVSTMPSFKMGQVYAIFPVAGVLCILAIVVHLLVTVTAKPEKEGV